MKKKLLLRGMLGFPLGLAMGYLITIFISLTVSDGRYYPCVPELAAVMGNEINAVLLQAVLCGILPAGAAACPLVSPSWGILKQTGIYFSIISVIMLPIAYVSYWMEHSLKGILGYFGIFVLIFAAVWIVQYTAAKHNVRKMNETLCRRRDAQNKEI